MNSEKGSTKIILYNTLSTIILYTITFFSAPIFSRILGAEDYGIVQVYNAWMQFFTVIVGLYTRGTISIAKINIKENEIEQYQSSILFLSDIFFLIVLFIVFVTKDLFASIIGLEVQILVLMLFHSFGNYCVFFINTKFTYDMKAKYNLIISVGVAIFNFVLSLVLIYVVESGKKYYGRILGASIPYIVAILIINIYLLKKGKTFYNYKYWCFCIPLCLPLIVHGISSIICGMSDRVMISKMLNMYSVGIYTLAFNFANIMDTIWNALNNSWNPFFFELYKKGDIKELKYRSINYIKLYTCLTIGFILLSPEVFRLFASSEYWEGEKVIPILVAGVYAIFVYSFFANYEFACKKTGMVACASLVTGLINIVLNYKFIIEFGYIGAAISTLISNVVLAYLHYIFAKRILKSEFIYTWRFFLPYIVCLIIAIITYYLFETMWIVRWILSVIVGIYMILNIYKNKAIF